MSHLSGPVPLASTEYVTRQFERDALGILLNREWLLMLGPRQHGKTSALLRIQRSLRDAGLRCAFVDLQALPPGLDFPSLAHWFASRVAVSLGHQLLSSPAWRRDSLEDWLSCAIPSTGAPTVVLIDESSAIRDEAVRNAFFGQIRALKSASAASEPGTMLGTLQFAFAGTFRPETLVDELNSPFNVCRRIDSNDLSLAEVKDLTALSLGGEFEPLLPDSIFAAVGGQPQLVQNLLAVATAAGSTDLQLGAIERHLELWREHGSDHIDSIFRAVVQDRELVKIAAIAVASGYAPNDPANVHYKYMTVLGLMRRDADRLVFRNQLYAQVAKASPQLTPEVVQTEGVQAHFYVEDVSAFSFIVDVEYREICFAAYTGAVRAANSGSYRLALVGFGTALEALLVDRLTREKPGDLAAAVLAAKKAKDQLSFTQHENSTDPSTWRLVNLMRVGRQLKRVQGPLDLPESLREMRNFVHPVLMKKGYLVEEKLRPEAIGAGGLFLAAKRDVEAS